MDGDYTKNTQEMKKATPQEVAHLHSVFCAATGFELKLRLCDYEREFAYVQFINAGFTADDINTVVRYLKRKIAAGERQPGALKWSNTIGAINRFEEDLCMAKAELRNAKPQVTPKQRVLEQAHPTIVPMTPDQGKDTSQPIGHYLEALRRAAQ